MNAVIRAVQQARDTELSRQQALSNASSLQSRQRLEVQFARNREHEAERIARLRNDQQHRAANLEPVRDSTRVGVPAMVDHVRCERGLDALSSSNLVFMRKMMQTLEPVASPQLKSKRAKNRTEVTHGASAAAHRAGLLEGKKALLKLQLANVEALQRTLAAEPASSTTVGVSHRCSSVMSAKSEASYATYGSRRTMAVPQKQQCTVPRIKLVRHACESEHSAKAAG
jgi:hypothetical protein